MSKDERLIALTEDVHYFPPVQSALKEPNGLLAVGGDLQPQRLINAYQHGIFPWYDDGPILWWCPDPRAVLFLDDLHISHSMQKVLKHHQFEIKMDTQFEKVIAQCRDTRKVFPGTWITPQMKEAYVTLHNMGYAHSLEVYQEGQLVGGIYGLSLGKLFFGESMFSLVSNSSKIALVFLVKQLKKWGFEFIDCQMPSEHLASLGTKSIPRALFLEKVTKNNELETKVGKWTIDIFD
ncbi:MAG: leucyl/phenylalanyl-tRNA--protein transferase [Candidatus Berkiella sp.]